MSSDETEYSSEESSEEDSSEDTSSEEESVEQEESVEEDTGEEKEEREEESSEDSDSDVSESEEDNADPQIYKPVSQDDITMLKQLINEKFEDKEIRTKYLYSAVTLFKEHRDYVLKSIEDGVEYEDFSMSFSPEFEKERRMFDREVDIRRNSVRVTTGIYTCKKCKNKKIAVNYSQDRAGDEMVDLLLTCITCGNRWKNA